MAVGYRPLKEVEKEKFDMKVYFRLLKYTFKYWKRLTIGLIAGFMVGGSLLAGLLLLPDMVESINPEQSNTIKISAGASRVLQAVENDPTWAKAGKEDKLRVIELALDPSKGTADPKLMKMLEQLRGYARKLNLPLVVGDHDLTITYPKRVSVPLIQTNGKLTWQVFAIYAMLFIAAWVVKNIASYVNHYCLRWVGTKVVADMREEIFAKLTRQSLAYYGKTDIGTALAPAGMGIQGLILRTTSSREPSGMTLMTAISTMRSR